MLSVFTNDTARQLQVTHGTGVTSQTAQMIREIAREKAYNIDG
jgi:phosphotransferase system IIB component